MTRIDQYPAGGMESLERPGLVGIRTDILNGHLYQQLHRLRHRYPDIVALFWTSTLPHRTSQLSSIIEDCYLGEN